MLNFFSNYNKRETRNAKPETGKPQTGFPREESPNVLAGNNSSSSFRDMFKATSLFGGVQVFNIIITIVRAKIVAVLLGSAGMGLNGLFLNTTNLINNLTNLGLPQSAVKVIAGAKGQGDEKEIAKTVKAFRKLIWVTALLGVIITMVLSSKLSEWVFESDKYTYSFMALSVTFIFGALAAGTTTILRGLRMLKKLAIVSMLGVLLGLLVSIPFYYIYGIKGVVPALICNSFIQMLIARFYDRKINLQKVSVTWLQAFARGSEMVKLGIILAITAFMDSGARLLISAFITRTGTLEVLGFYNAGVSITVGYTGLVFTAMITDYFPRLTEALSQSVTLWRSIVNQQLYLVILILTPILIFIMTTLPFVIRVLLTEEFLVIDNLVSLLILAIFIQGPVWALGVIIVAKSDLKIKFYTELAGQLLVVICVLLFFKMYGLIGAGIGFLLSRIFHLLMGLIISRYRYQFMLNRKVVLLMSLSFILCAFLTYTQLKWDYPVTHWIGIGLLVLSAAYSLIELNRLLDIRRSIQAFKKRLRR